MAVVWDKMRAVQTKGTIVGTHTQSCATIAEDGRADHTPLFKNEAQGLFHLFHCLGERDLKVRTDAVRGKLRLCLEEQSQKTFKRKATVVSRCLWNRERTRRTL